MKKPVLALSVLITLAVIAWSAHRYYKKHIEVPKYPEPIPIPLNDKSFDEWRERQERYWKSRGYLR